MADLIGQRLGNYQVTSLLGEGGMASVYRARQINIDRDVAIKVIDAKLARSPEFLRRFEREARTIASLNHAHILKLFDYGQHEDTIFLVMELLMGGSLAAQVRQGPLPVERVAAILDQIASALDYAHQKGIVHRDLKPQNVLFDEAGQAHLTDFGIAKIGNDATALTMSGMAMGTPMYMAPEQWQGGDLDARSDVYALGVMLYEMLSGQAPFLADTPATLMYKHLQETPPSLQARRPELPAGVEAVLVKALAKNRDQRFSSAGEVASAFRRALAGQPVPGLESEAAGADLTSPVAVSPTPRRTPVHAPPLANAPSPRRGAPRGLLALGALFVIGIVVVAALALSGAGRGASPTAPVETPTLAVASAPTSTPTAISPTPATAVPATPTHEAPSSTPQRIAAMPSTAMAVTATATEPPTVTPTLTLTDTSTTTSTATLDIPATVAAIVAITNTAAAAFTDTPTPDIPATVAAIMAQTSAAIVAFTSTPPPTPTDPPTPTLTPTATATLTLTPDVPATVAAIVAMTDTAIAAYTDTPTITPSHTPSATPSPSATATLTFTPTNTSSLTPSHTPTATDTLTPTSTATPRPTDTATFVPISVASVARNADWTPMVRTFDGVEMVLVPPGCFTMGRENGQEVERPVHLVCFDRPFWLDRTEVTNGQFALFGFSAANTSASVQSGPDYPRDNVTWYEARDFCAVRGARLPTEAEWEYAARGPDGLRYPWGNSFDGTRANYCDSSCPTVWRDTSTDDGYPQSAPVGSYPSGASWVGALDMIGNLSERLHSQYRPYPYRTDDGREADSGVGTDVYHLVRGGSFYVSKNDAEAATRVWWEPDFAHPEAGIRCARDFAEADLQEAAPLSTPAPVEAAASVLSPVTHNADWKPVTQSFDGVAMLLVPPGCFTMGSTDAQLDYAVSLGANRDWYLDEQPPREVCFDKPFWIDDHEVTNRQFDGLGGTAAQASAYSNPNRPRTNITWYEAGSFCLFRFGRLPTSAEWEYAARGPDSLIFPWGDTFSPDSVTYADNSNREPAVFWGGGSRSGGVSPSWVGATDMSGNVAEWTSDWVSESAAGARGGSFYSPSSEVRAARRAGWLVNEADPSVGFRCVRDFEEGDLAGVPGIPLPGAETSASSAESGVWATALVPLRVRSGPGTEYRQVGNLNTGDRIAVWGRTADAQWLYYGPGWVSASSQYVQVEGYVLGLEIITIAPPN